MLSFFRRKKKQEPAEIENEATEATIEQGEQPPETEQTEINDNSEISAENAKIPSPDTQSAENLEAPEEETIQTEQKQTAEAHHEESDKKTSIEASTETEEEVTKETDTESTEAAPEQPAQKPGFFTRLKQSLSKTRMGFTESLASLFLGKKEIDEDLLDELEMILLTADIGVDTTDRIIQNLTDQVSRKELKDPEALFESLKIQLREILHPVESPLDIDNKPADEPFVILVVGVNGAGKTTTIGKLAHRFQQEGKSVMLAAGDTFRAAAVEQLQTWGERNGVPVIAQKTGADSAAVIFDAVQSAKAKGIDVLIADTAGRLHTQSNLMEELKKVKRVIQKVLPDAPHETLLVLDAGTGQNALSQAKLFNEAVQLTGLTLTKLDGTAKGGVIFTLADQLKAPVRFIGVGEGIEDLRPFQANEFIEALFDTHEVDPK